MNLTKKYVITALLFAVLYLGLIISVVTACHPYHQSRLIDFLFMCLFYIPVKPLFRYIANTVYLSALYKRLDPIILKENLNSGFPRLPVTYKILAEYSLGNYQFAINSLHKRIAIKQSRANHAAILAMARIYFELDDVEALNVICEQFNVQSNGNKELNNKYPITAFYQLYIDGRYHECIEFCKQRLEKLKNKSDKYNLNRLNNYFNLAVSYYKNGDITDAKKWFEEIIQFAPKMYVAEISKKYLANIENGTVSVVEFPKIYPDDNYREEKYTVPKKQRIVRRICYAVIIVSYVICAVISDSNYKSKLVEYEKQLNDAVDVMYDDFVVLGYSDIKIGDDAIDNLVVVYSEDKIDILSYVEYADGTKAVILRQSDITVNTEYAMTSIIKNYSMIVGLYDNAYPVGNETVTKMGITYQNNEYVLCVSDCTPLTP